MAIPWLIMYFHVCDRERGGKCDLFSKVGFERQHRRLYTNGRLPSKQLCVTVNREFHLSN